MKSFLHFAPLAVFLALQPAPAAAQTAPVPAVTLAPAFAHQPGRAQPAALAAANARSAPQVRIDPTCWYVGLRNPRLQLLVHGPGIGGGTATLGAYPGVTLTSVEKLPNRNYLVLNVMLAPTARPGQLRINFSGPKTQSYTYELRARATGPDRVQGLTQADFVYLLMPDRFANGDPTNDVVPGTQVNHIARDSMYARHGGDLKGIANQFGYLKKLGVTAIWPTPIVENDQPKFSYHGYELSDYYAVDPRYGTQQEYIDFVAQAHQQGLKVIHDVVLNHCGNRNYLFRDAPAPNWFHQWPTFTRSNFRDAAFNDPHGAATDRKLFGEGWFDTHMPDLDQTNPLVATYLIQNFIWWVEQTGLDGYRLDTYAYSDRKFLMRFGEEILKQYPRLAMYGETWVQGTAQQAYFARNILPAVDGFKSNLPGVTDFQLYYAINDALTKDAGWTEGVSKLYYTLQTDWLYEDATRNVTFLDNHDLSRFYSMVGEDFAKYKMGLAWLLTCRGIPQLYYGTEVLMKNYSDPDGKVREDFPGGWPGDATNLFTTRTGRPAEAFDYVARLAAYRRTHPALHSGQLTHFIPADGVYTYFRHSAAGTVMVVMNAGKDEKTVDGTRFAERTAGFRTGLEVTSGQVLPNLSSWKIPARTAWVMELQK